MRILVLLMGAGATLLLSGCGTPDEPKPVGPRGSDVSYMPWNRPQPGEGTAQFGGAFDRR